MVQYFVKLETEFLHSSGFVQFIFLGFIFLTLFVALLRVFKYKIPIHGDYPEDENNKESQPSYEQKQQNKQLNDKNQDNDQQQSNQQQINQQSDPSSGVNQEDIGIGIDDDDEPEVPNQEIEKEKPKEQQRIPRSVESQDSDEQKQNNIQSNSPTLLERFCKHIDSQVDKYLIPLTISIFLINSWGCYIYTAFVTSFCVMLTMFFEVVPFVQDSEKMNLTNILPIIYHMWILTLFFAYFVYDQGFKNNQA